MKDYLLQHSNDHLAERKFISPDKFTSTSGWTVFQNSIAMATYAGNIGGIIIDSVPMAQMMEQFFLVTWNSL
jgi:hypothetical protein